LIILHQWNIFRVAVVLLIAEVISRFKKTASQTWKTKVITGDWPLQNFTKFHGNMKILRKQTNSVAQLKIVRPVENCGPYLQPAWSMNEPYIQTLN